MTAQTAPRTSTRPVTPPRGAWTDATRDVVELVAEGITELAGFRIAAISLLSGDEWTTIAIAGDDDARSSLLGVQRPVSIIRDRMAIAEEWGRWRFVPAERLAPDDGPGWVPDLAESSDRGAWQPRDILFAPLHDRDATLLGVLSVDLPTDGRRPDRARRAELDRYAAQAERSLLLAVEQAELAERVRMLYAAQEVCRTASRALDRSDWDECRRQVMAGFHAYGLWLHTIDGEEGGWSRSSTIAPEVAPTLTERSRAAVEHMARTAWSRQEVVRLTDTAPVPRHLTRPEDRGALRHLIAQFEQHRVAAAIFVPVGAGPECLGHLLLTRPHGRPDWTEIECEVALEMGHDLGSSLVNARAFAREQQLAEELVSLDSYRSRLIATLAHELKNPLAAIGTNTELLAGDVTLPEGCGQLLAEVRSGADSVAALVDRLLALARLSDPALEVGRGPQDLTAIAAEAVRGHEQAARAAGVDLSAHLDRVTVPGEADDLRQLVEELVDNAIRFTDRGGRAEVCLTRVGTRAVLSVTNVGPGPMPVLSDEMLREFAVAPQHHGRGGPGLGLALAATIVGRHGGRLDVGSGPELGCRVAAVLPVA